MKRDFIRACSKKKKKKVKNKELQNQIFPTAHFDAEIIACTHCTNFQADKFCEEQKKKKKKKGKERKVRMS